MAASDAYNNGPVGKLGVLVIGSVKFHEDNDFCHIPPPSRPIATVIVESINSPQKYYWRILVQNPPPSDEYIYHIPRNVTVIRPMKRISGGNHLLTKMYIWCIPYIYQ